MRIFDELVQLILANEMVSISISMTERSSSSPPTEMQAHPSESFLQLILA